MKIKYAGPRPVISHHGVTFKEGKEDKYVYLEDAIDILISIDNDYSNVHAYSHNIRTEDLTDDEMQDCIAQYHPDLQEVMAQEIVSYEEHLAEEKNIATNQVFLNKSEREALEANHDIMHDYRLQRAKNKIFYEHIVQTICEVIKREKIKEIDTPFHEKFWHILQTIEGELAVGRHSIGSSLKVEKQKDEMVARLLIEI